MYLDPNTIQLGKRGELLCYAEVERAELGRGDFPIKAFTSGQASVYSRPFFA